MMRKLLSNNFIKSFFVACILFFLFSGTFSKNIQTMKDKISSMFGYVTSSFMNHKTAAVSATGTTAETKSGYITKEDIIGSAQKGKRIAQNLAETAVIGYINICEWIYDETFTPLDPVIENLGFTGGEGYLTEYFESIENTEEQEEPEHGETVPLE